MKKNLMNKVAMAMVVAAVFLLPMAAFADSLSTVNFVSTAGLSVSMVSYENGTKHTYNGTASYFNVNAIDDGLLVTTPDTADKDWFAAFCVDPFQGAGVGNVDLVAPSAVQGGLQAAWLFEKYYFKSQDHSKEAITALQVAIWEVVVDYDQSKPSYNYNLNLTSGDYYVTKINNIAAPSATLKNPVWSLADSMLADLQQNFDAKDLDYMYRIAQSGTKQDLIMRLYDAPVGDPAGTPEPATMILMGIGVIGLAGYRKFRKN